MTLLNVPDREPASRMRMLVPTAGSNDGDVLIASVPLRLAVAVEVSLEKSVPGVVPPLTVTPKVPPAVCA